MAPDYFFENFIHTFIQCVLVILISPFLPLTPSWFILHPTSLQIACPTSFLCYSFLWMENFMYTYNVLIKSISPLPPPPPPRSLHSNSTSIPTTTISSRFYFSLFLFLNPWNPLSATNIHMSVGPSTGAWVASWGLHHLRKLTLLPEGINCHSSWGKGRLSDNHTCSFLCRSCANHHAHC